MMTTVRPQATENQPNTRAARTLLRATRPKNMTRMAMTRPTSTHDFNVSSIAQRSHPGPTQVAQSAPGPLNFLSTLPNSELPEDRCICEVDHFLRAILRVLVNFCRARRGVDGILGHYGLLTYDEWVLDHSELVSFRNAVCGGRFMVVPKSPVGCPMDALLRLLMGPWTTYILWVLRSNGPTRFGELKRRVAGVSAKVLSERLRMLVEAGVVHRQFEATIPPQVTYSMTVRGEELREVLDRLNEVAVRWQAADKAAASASAALDHSAGAPDRAAAGVAVAAS